MSLDLNGHVLSLILLDKMVADKRLIEAVSRLTVRADRYDEQSKVVDTYVDIGILPQLNNRNNQIMFGRRGTGKTHLFRMLHNALRGDARNAVCYIDMRILGSTSQYSDSMVPIKQRAICLFRDILGTINNTLLDHLVQSITSVSAQPRKDENDTLELLARFSSTVTSDVIKYDPTGIEERQVQNVETSVKAMLSASTGNMTAGLTSANTHKNEQEMKHSFSADHQDKIIFPEVYALLDAILKRSRTRLYVLLDEWSSVPELVQPTLAEFLKRSFLPSPRISIKIASIEQRSQFSERIAVGLCGFELGADVTVAVDLDDYFVYDRNPTKICEVFADILHGHTVTELPAGYLPMTFEIHSSAQLIKRLFHGGAFEELVRASEGVVRDYLHIFTQAYFVANRKGYSCIEKECVAEAAKDWFEIDKKRNLDDSLRIALERIVKEIIVDRRSRHFFLPRELQSNQIIKQLFDARVIHLMFRGYVDHDDASVAYDIYTLDYGTYVQLLSTRKRPQPTFREPAQVVEANEVLVPFDDQRSIRKIVLTPGLVRITASMRPKGEPL